MSTNIYDDETTITLAVFGAPGSGKSTLIDTLVQQSNAVLQVQGDSVEKSGPSRSTTKRGRQASTTLPSIEADRTVVKIKNKIFTLVELNDMCSVEYKAVNISQADYSMFVVSADPSHTIDLQFFGVHDLLVYFHFFFVRPLLIVITKMDKTEPTAYNKRWFCQIKEHCKLFFCQTRFWIPDSKVVPVSGLLGDNLLHPSDSMQWKSCFSLPGSKKSNTLGQILGNLQSSPRLPNLPLRLPILRVVLVEAGEGPDKSENIVTVEGRLAVGQLEVGKAITICPGNVKGQVKSIEVNGSSVVEANDGQFTRVVFVVADYMDKCQDKIQRGSVITRSFDGYEPVTRIIAKILDPQSPTSLCDGLSASICCHTASTDCIVVKVSNDITERERNIHDMYFKGGQVVRIEILLGKPLCVFSEEDCIYLSKFTLYRDDCLLGFGLIEEVFCS